MMSRKRISHGGTFTVFLHQSDKQETVVMLLAEPVFFHWRDDPRYHAGLGVREQRGHKKTTYDSKSLFAIWSPNKTDTNFFSGPKPSFTVYRSPDRQMPECLFIDWIDSSFHGLLFPFNRIMGLATSLIIMDLTNLKFLIMMLAATYFYQKARSVKGMIRTIPDLLWRKVATNHYFH